MDRVVFLNIRGAQLCIVYNYNCVMNGYFLRKMKKSTKLLKENTALFKVLASWCLYHQQQIMGMLKFLKEEHGFCSPSCHNNAQSHSAEQLSRSPHTSCGTCRICTNQKSKSIKLNEETQLANFPYLTVCLKDLRFTWPNLNLGTVKLNLSKKEDVNLSDQLLHSINTRSKKKTQSVYFDCLSSHHSTTPKKSPVSSSLPTLKVERTTPGLESNMMKPGLQCRCTRSQCRLEISNCCQTDNASDRHTTVIKNVALKESCYTNKKTNKKTNNRLKPYGKNIRKNTSDSSTSSCVNFGNLIKHFLNSETNGFAELLSPKENCSKSNVETRYHRNNEKMLIFDNALSEGKTVDFAREFNNLSDTFLKEKNNFVKNSPNTVAISAEEHARDVLVLEDCESPNRESKYQKITDLPHCTLKIPSENVNCVKDSQLGLPSRLKHSVPQRIVRENKRHADQDVQIESTISPKRYSRNILGRCKLCDLSHGLCSFQDNSNLFCKCTIQKNSGILKNFKAEGAKFRNPEKNRNAHLKVVVQRLEDSKLSDNDAINNKDICKSNINLCNKSKVKASSCVLNMPQKTLNNVKQSNCLNSALVEQTNTSGLEGSHKPVSKASIPTTSSDNSYFSPIKLMFVSKVESEDGVKYTLSSEYTPINNHENVKLSDSVEKASHTWKPNGTQNRFSKTMASPRLPESKDPGQNNLAKMSNCPDQSHFERNRCKKRFCQISKNIAVESQHKKCSQKTFAIAGSDTAVFANVTGKSNKRTSSKLSKSKIAKTYVVQTEGSGTQLRIKKVERCLRSSERNLHLNESKSPNSQRISKRLKKLRKLSNVSGVCRTNDSISQKGGKGFLSHFQEKILQYGKKEEIHREEQDQTPQTTLKRKWTLSSLRIRKLKHSGYNTRSRKHLASSFSSVPSSNISVRSASCHKSRKLESLSKCRAYKMRLRGHEQPHKLPLLDTKCTVSRDENCTANIDVQPSNVLKWWSASTSKESLLKDLERKYEQIANTWLEENEEKDNEAQSLSTLKFCRSEIRSPVQVLFTKKCDMGDLAAWFMQTTETQPLSIVRKAVARSSLHKINRKDPTIKAKKSSINTCRYKKHFKKCAGSTPSETLAEPHNVSKTIKGKCKVVQDSNSVKIVTDQSQGACVKFSCPEKNIDVTKACAETDSANFKASAKDLAQSSNVSGRNAACQGAATISNSLKHINSLGSYKKQKMLVQNKSKSNSNTMYFCYSRKQNIQDCKVFLTKLGDGESKRSCGYRESHSGYIITGNKVQYKPELKLKRNFDAKYCLRMNKSHARSPHTLRIKNSTSQNNYFGMCLRKSKAPGAIYNSHSESLILERQKRLSKLTLYVETNTKRSKPQILNMGKTQSECPNLQLGPIKPIGIPAIRGLSSKSATYSLTPIRIPLQ